MPTVIYRGREHVYSLPAGPGGGKVSVESTLERGTIFGVTLPVKCT